MFSAAAVETLVHEVRRHQPGWEAMPPQGRKRWLLAWQHWILDNIEHIADVIQSETGKPRVDALLEPAAGMDLIAYYARNAGKFLADEHPAPHSLLARAKRITVRYRPYQAVGVIAPWNYPLAIPMLDVVPALAAGASVVLKPSELTPLSALALQRGWQEIGAPPVFAVATGGGETGAAVVNHVDYVQFTGSTGTGRKIAVACAERLIPCSLELGGKDPAIVLADADLDRAVAGVAYGGLVNSGQVCASVERVYVEEPVYDVFVAKLVDHVGKVRQGCDQTSPGNDVGTLASDRQREIVREHVDEARAKGARALTGGRAPELPGNYYLPTILVDVDHGMKCMTEETFGPTLPVMKVSDEQEAIELANDSVYGLSATVWTKSSIRGRRVAEQLNVGSVNINDALANIFSFALPMGGWKQSGIGSRGGANGLRKYCQKQAITASRFRTGSTEPLWLPYKFKTARFALALMQWTSTRRIRIRSDKSPRP
ncbi:aldehyde dehydrogenase [Mycobacteroides stephanolepidis]|uniref:Aldehyde dehydrogenase n=1 Tax=[Mycobacterium] stephanolepidis TaxID=1520670 RepID=A0A1Z4EXZ2_9MYCO|nr:aldehyde dehydrogenase [[Mycobacterium] stephanolepidis]